MRPVPLTAMALFLAQAALFGAGRPTDHPHRPGELIVKFKKLPANLPARFSPQSFDDLGRKIEKILEKSGAVSAERLYPEMKKPTTQALSVHGATVPVPDLYGAMVLKFSTSTELEALIDYFFSQPEVLYVHPNYLKRLFLSPNDPKLVDQWWNQNTGQTGANAGWDPATGTPYADVRSTTAWEITTGSATTIIAVIDTGIRLTHEDLAQNLWANDDPPDGLDNDNNGFIDDYRGWDFGENDADPSDNSPTLHGTGVAGVAAGYGNNGKGGAGVMWRASLMSLKVAKSDGTLDIGAIARATKYAADNGARVINMSFGGSDDPSGKDAVEYASAKGVLLIAAAGNMNQSNPDGEGCGSYGSYPAAYPNVMAVAATNRQDKRAYDPSDLCSGTHYGSWIDVAAPGAAIYMPWGTSDSAYISGYGTSFASPMVAGIAGLVLSRYPYLTAAQVRSRIENSCKNIDALNPGYEGKLGFGRVNAAKALVPMPPSNVRVTGVGLDSASWSWSLADGATHYNLYLNNARVANFNNLTSVMYAGLNPNTPNVLEIRGVNQGGESFESAASTTAYTLAAVPTNFNNTSVAATSASFSWGANGNPPDTSYDISYWTAGGSTVSVQMAGATAIVSDLRPQNTYYFQLKAINRQTVYTVASGAPIKVTTTGFPSVISNIAVNQSKIIVFNPPAGAVELHIATGTFASAVTITVSLPIEVPIGVAPSFAHKATGVVVEINVSNGLVPSKFSNLTMYYRDSDVAGLDETKLVLARYDAIRNSWVPLETIAYPALNKVQGFVDHFSLFQIMSVTTQGSVEVSRVKIFPNPFRQALGHRKVTLSQLPPGGRVSIYTMAGELLQEGKTGDSGMFFWDTLSSYGHKAASGMYLIVVTDKDEKNREVLKLGIER